MKNEVTVIGAAIMDITAAPVSKELFIKGSVPADKMKLSYGGDALNESSILSILSVDTSLVSVIGDDEIGCRVLSHLKECRIKTDNVAIASGLVTGMNIVLTDSEGERHFITNPESSLRKLSLEHILPYVDSFSDVVSFASMFVSPMLGIVEMEELFSKIKERTGRILISDMTTAKRGEKIDDIAGLLKHIDYLIPNLKEASLLTGESDPIKNARIFTEHGAGAAVIKCGSDGCVYKLGEREGVIPAYHANVVDTTGAGDSFVAGFIYGIINGMNIEDCCRFANATASFVTEDVGTTGKLTGLDQVQQRMKSV
jgi:sugar/nucleoside kinase (ribokinase family)